MFLYSYSTEWVLLKTSQYKGISLGRALKFRYSSSASDGWIRFQVVSFFFKRKHMHPKSRERGFGKRDRS